MTTRLRFIVSPYPMAGGSGALLERVATPSAAIRPVAAAPLAVGRDEGLRAAADRPARPALTHPSRA